MLFGPVWMYVRPFPQMPGRAANVNCTRPSGARHRLGSRLALRRGGPGRPPRRARRRRQAASRGSDHGFFSVEDVVEELLGARVLLAQERIESPACGCLMTVLFFDDVDTACRRPRAPCDCSSTLTICERTLYAIRRVVELDRDRRSACSSASAARSPCARSWLGSFVILGDGEHPLIVLRSADAAEGVDDRFLHAIVVGAARRDCADTLRRRPSRDRC